MKGAEKILEMITALSPRSHSTAAIATSTQTVPDNEQNDPKRPEDDDWETPKPEWTLPHYHFAFWRMTMLANEESAETINRVYLATELASQDDNTNTWKAFCEYTRLKWGKGGNFASLRALAEEYPNSVGVLKYLGQAFKIYQDYAESARIFESGFSDA